MRRCSSPVQLLVESLAKLADTAPGSAARLPRSTRWSWAPMASSKSSAVQECLPLSCTTCGAEMRLITFPTEPPTVAPTPNRTLRYVDISNSGGLQLANVRLARRNMTTSGRQADRPFTTLTGPSRKSFSDGRYGRHSGLTAGVASRDVASRGVPPCASRRNKFRGRLAALSATSSPDRRGRGQAFVAAPR